MRSRIILPLLAMLLPSAAIGQPLRGEEGLARMLGDRRAGTPVSCINLRDIRNSRVVGRTAIVYRMNNGTLYVNRPSSGAEALRDEDILVTRSIGTRLCAPDVVTLVDRNAGFFSGSVSLGEFVPYTTPPRASRRL